jgi:drug/metabolite transporter (DMT)-like permease
MTESHDTSTGKKTAGAFDIRIIIAMLIGLYGVVLVVTGLVATSDADLEKADGININLWGGLGMAAVAALFLAWARLRPIVVEDPPEGEEHGSA